MALCFFNRRGGRSGENYILTDTKRKLHPRFDTRNKLLIGYLKKRKVWNKDKRMNIDANTGEVNLLKS